MSPGEAGQGRGSCGERTRSHNDCKSLWKGIISASIGNDNSVPVCTIHLSLLKVSHEGRPPSGPAIDPPMPNPGKSWHILLKSRTEDTTTSSPGDSTNHNRREHLLKSVYFAKRILKPDTELGENCQDSTVI